MERSINEPLISMMRSGGVRFISDESKEAPAVLINIKKYVGARVALDHALLELIAQKIGGLEDIDKMQTQLSETEWMKQADLFVTQNPNSNLSSEFINKVDEEGSKQNFKSIRQIIRTILAKIIGYDK